MPSMISRVSVEITATLSNVLDMQEVTVPMVVRRALDLANGAGANQANVVFADTRTLGPSASESLDLVGGGLVDALGVAVAPARLRALLIYSSPANLNNLTILGNAAAVPILNTVATTITLTPGGLFLITKPDAVGMLVTATTSDLLVITNAAGVNSVSYDIVAIGSAT